MSHPDTISVLIADDQPDIRMLVRAILNRAGGFHVLPTEATNGEEAIALASDHTPHVVVLDIAMPVLDGLEAIEDIRRQSPDSQIVMFSANDDPDLTARALRSGAAAFVSKVQCTELPGRLRDVCAVA